MILFLLACAPDDVTDKRNPGDTNDTSITDTGDTSDTSVDDTGASGSLVGDWVSTGADICPLLAEAPFNYTRIEASFESDLSYTVQVTNADGQTGTLRGSYSTSTGTTPDGITLSQTAPTTATALGIYLVEGDVLTYEVVQTDPDYGFTPPTPATGFGSTQGEGLEPGVNVQVYRR